MNKKISLGITIGLMALTATITFILSYNYSINIFNEKVKSVTEKEETYTKLSEIDKYVRGHYYMDINEDTLLNGIISGYVEGLGDPYACYYTAEEYKSLSEKDTGITTGLGFSYEKEESGYIIITGITPGSSAEDEGLRNGDIITAVNNTDVIAFDGGYDSAIKLLKCNEGTKVKLHIKRIDSDGVADFFSLDVVSKTTEIVTVTSYMIDTKGYLHVSDFNDKTPEQFKSQLDVILAQQASSLIIDLRDNSSDSISAMGETLDLIVGAGNKITAHYKGSTEVLIETTEANKIELPVIVLVNQNTQGAAELFAVALRDYLKAQIVGITTYGKGVMQETSKLTDGSAIKVSVATLQTDNSRDFTGKGIKPEYEIALPDELQYKDLNDENREKDTQLDKAIEIADTVAPAE